MKILDIYKLKEMLVGGAKQLEINKEYVDSLNVFPVPDGDTGANMSMTLSTAVKEMSTVESDRIDDVVNAFSRGALKGARGNSGVILSQIIKGMAKVLVDVTEVNTKVFAKALVGAADMAYSAVTKPKEGTILTVIRYIAENASSLAMRNSSFENFFEKILEKGQEILNKTPDMLPVLKKAGVVDAGGQGLLYMLQGYYNIIAGIEMDSVIVEGETPIEAVDNFVGDIHDLEDIKYAYCTEFFVVNLFNSTTEEDIEILRDTLMTLGDSVICIGDLSMVKVHIHTNQPNKALKFALKLGELDKVKIENMLIQNRELMAKKLASKKNVAVITVCAGEGLAKIFKDLQVDTVIEGGQTMNPSVDDILTVIDRVNSDNIIVLPNNKNIILAAEQAKELSEKNVKIINTVNVPEGIAACVVFDANNDIDTNVENMIEAIAEVSYGEVTYAVRSTNMDGFDLHEGDIIGITNGSIVSQNDNVCNTVTDVIDKLVDDEKSVITLYYGEDVTEEEANSLVESLSEKYEDLEIDAYMGGQHHYFYMISVE